MRHWDKLNRIQKKHVREIARVAYERELAAALDKLHASFQDWKQGRITPFELDVKIHQHHDGVSREFYNRYATDKPDMVVLHALNEGVLKIEELNEDCRSFYQEWLERFRE